VPRTMTIAASGSPVGINISIFRAENLIINVTPEGLPLVLTISATSGGVPLIEIPSAVVGQISIGPDNYSSLLEGVSYFMNIWNKTDKDDPQLIAYGAFVTAKTIQPFFVQYATQFFEDGRTIVGPISQDEYDALTPEQKSDSNVIYIIEETIV